MSLKLWFYNDSFQSEIGLGLSGDRGPKAKTGGRSDFWKHVPALLSP